jgi:6-phospho-3-hexuloisomerase
MKVIDYTNQVVAELAWVLRSLDESSVNKIIDMILGAKEIFVCGAGRSGLMAKGFAMRMMHLGLTSFVVGETVTPNIGNDGLLLVCSGSGETASLLMHAQKAKKLGAKIALITINPQSTIGLLSDAVVEIKAPSPKLTVASEFKSIQPMGSLFEQSLLLTLDLIVLGLMEASGQDSDGMFGRHANLE